MPFAYFPPISYMGVLIQSDCKFKLEGKENFHRQTLRSRCIIIGGNGPLSLNVPVHGARKKILTQDIQIDNSQAWQHQHWRSITSAYGNAPFFDHYEPPLREIFNNRYELLHQLTMATLTMCLEMLRLKADIDSTESFIHTYPPGVKDLRWVFDEKDPDAWPDFFSPVPYTQVFGKRFAANVSVLDVLCCEGPSAEAIIRSSFRGFSE